MGDSIRAMSALAAQHQFAVLAIKPRAPIDQFLDATRCFFNDHFNHGLTYATSEQYEAALEEFSRAIELDPDDAQAYSNRGTAYHQLQQYEGALEDFGRAIELDPTNAEFHARVANVLAGLVVCGP